MVWFWLMWLRIGTSGGPLRTRYWTFGFHKMLGGSWVATQLASLPERLSSVSKYVFFFFVLAIRNLHSFELISLNCELYLRLTYIKIYIIHSSCFKLIHYAGL
jgi:hypothetical protein